MLRYLVQKALGVVVHATSKEQQRAALDVYRHEFQIPEKEMTLLEEIASKTGDKDQCLPFNVCLCISFSELKNELLQLEIYAYSLNTVIELHVTYSIIRDGGRK